MLSESIRLQLAGTSVRVIELEPPSVRTGLLPARRTARSRCRSDEFITEAVSLLESQPDAKEIQSNG